MARRYEEPTDPERVRTMWRARLRGYAPGGFWLPSWGRRPEAGNPRIPKDLWPPAVRLPYREDDA